jgi:hypothetical protein
VHLLVYGGEFTSLQSFKTIPNSESEFFEATCVGTHANLVWPCSNLVMLKLNLGKRNLRWC